MDEHSVKLYKYISLGFSAVLIGLALLICVVTYLHKDTTSKNPLIFWTIENHLPITIGIIILSGFIGHICSTLIYKQLVSTQNESKKLMETVFLFLGNDEKQIMSCLVHNPGAVGQAEISRLPGMNRVKAYRSLQKMQQKNLIDITTHGKIRRISLKDNALKLLTR